MIDGLDSGADGAFENDDLSAQLGAAFDQIEAGTAPTSEPLALLDTGADDVAATAQAAADRARDERGRFAPKPGETAPEPTAAQPPVDPAAAPIAPEAPAAAPEAVRPPPGWSPQSKADFATLPAHIQADIAKREAEVNQGFAKLAEFKGKEMDEFVQAARGAGISPGELAGRYRAAEAKLAQNFVGGVHELAQAMGKHPVAVAAGLIGMEPNAFVAALRAGHAQGGASAQPDQSGAAAPAPAGALPPQVASEISRLSQVVNGLITERTTAHQTQAAAVIDSLFNDPKYPYAANVENEIAILINRDPKFRENPRESFDRAYQTAVYMHPETRQLLIKQEMDARAAAVRSTAADNVARARAASRSVTGSPLAGASTQPARQSTGSLQSDLEAAWDAMSSSV